MASNVSTVDGMGFEEVNQSSFTETISGTYVYASNSVVTEGVLAGSFIGNFAAITDVYPTNLYSLSMISGPTVKATTISGTTIRVGGEGAVHSTSIQNATELFGYRIKAGSVLTGDYGSGEVVFATPFTTANYFVTSAYRDYGTPQFNRNGSQGASFGTSGTRATGSFWIIGGSVTVVDWIAVGI